MAKLLVRETQLRLRRQWLPAALLIVLLVLLQTVFGHYRGIETEAWLWILLALAPVTVLLYAARWIKPYVPGMVEPSALRSYRSLLWIYALLILLTILLSQAAVNLNDWGLKDYMGRSLWWLLPTNLLTLGGLADLLLRNKTGNGPTSDAIAREAQARSERIDTDQHPLRKKCLVCIGESDLPGAMALLEQHFEEIADNRSLNQLIIRKGEYQRLVRSMEREVIAPEEAQRQLNRIALALLEMSALVKA
ncbi:MAG: hypothetical protein KDC54_04655 [Lewinella sp.]|nr:hypothetical protein [Lewinella sp.]